VIALRPMPGAASTVAFFAEEDFFLVAMV
jgi:hypothetical protein